VSSDRWQKIGKLVDGALDCPPSERARFLDKACPDAEMRKEVESLLSYEREGFLEEPAAEMLDLAGQPTEQSAAPPDLTGRVLSRYRIEETLGSGGMGEVFLAHDPALDRRVALKLLARNLEADAAAKQRFLREARSAAALDHPYICKIYETGEASLDANGSEKRSFIAMEHIVGETLASRLRSKPMAPDEAIRIALEIADALETAHHKDIVHRDLKPANIMLTVGGHVKVLDFGLAKRVALPSEGASQFETASHPTPEGAALGTLAYMSPEQLRGELVDARSDVFSFGVVLFEMLAGTHPFSQGVSVDTAAAILNKSPPPLARYSEVPEVLQHVVDRMLAKEPGERYQLVGEVRADLERARRPNGEAHSHAAARPPALRQKRVQRVLIAAAAGVVLVGAVWAWRGFPTRGWLFGGAPDSVVVLPLTNISDDLVDSDHLAAGISQAVARRLGRIGLRVAPWETARRFGGGARAASAVARELNVDTVLRGTFQISGDQMIANVALVHADSGFQTWADIVVAPYEDLFDLPLRIASGVAETVTGGLTEEERALLSAPESASVDAYEHYMQGSYFLSLGTVDATRAGLRYLQSAIELDPELAPAHASAGAVYAARWDYGWEGGQANLALAEASLQEALRLDPAEMTARSGMVSLSFFKGQSEAALAQGRAAATLAEADDVEALLVQAKAFGMAGLPDLTLPLLDRVIELDPANQEASLYRVLAHAWADDLERLIAAGDDHLQRFGSNLEVETLVAQAHHVLGSLGEARRHYESAIALVGQTESAGGAVASALLYSGMLFDQAGERDRAEDQWQQGLELAEASLTDYPDNIGIRLIRAMFQGLLGDRAALAGAWQQALDGNFNAYQLHSLAATHVALGDVDSAVDVLTRTVELGSIAPLWKLQLSVASPAVLESDAFQPFLETYAATAQRLRRGR